ncbi:unnamed protein product [Trifolium pratense]|uniref:Uncharacterized protein n=1 Tax=Trifolium pratense TaxID=57577 RepID=A0ACB0KZB5_TRIPR|nr:unnamed protein product [Trifolium pratense]
MCCSFNHKDMGHWTSKLETCIEQENRKEEQKLETSKNWNEPKEIRVWDMPAVKQVLMLSNSGFWIASFTRSDARECTDQFSDAGYLRLLKAWRLRAKWSRRHPEILIRCYLFQFMCHNGCTIFYMY